MRTIIFGSVILIMINSGMTKSIDHALFDSVLQTYVKNGLVDYQALNDNRAALTDYLHQLEHINPNDFENWSRDEQMALWIDAYNAITLEAILRNYPIQWGGLLARARFPKSSIRQIKKVWDTVYIRVMGRELTLNQIEHEILRKEFADPRIHFAIVCASIGCPLLESHAFFADDLDQRLEGATKNFISDSNKVRLDRSGNILYLSPIFDWYKDDFKANDESDTLLANYDNQQRGIIQFLLDRLNDSDREFLISRQPEVKYLDYDWSLNEQK